MAAITTAVMAATAVAGIGMQAYAMNKQQEGAERSAEGARIQSMGSEVQAMGAQRQSEGAMIQVKGAEAQNAAQKEITKLEFQSEAQRFQAMELDAKRRQMEVIRNQQRARSLGLTAATSQGASKGSGLQGAFGQISGASGVNLSGIQQNLAIGRNIFEINRGISDQRLAYAAGGDIINQGQGVIAQGAAMNAFGAGFIARGGGVVAEGQGITAQGAGWAQMGQSLVSASSTFGNVAGSASGAFGNIFGGGGGNQISYSGSGGMYYGSRGGIYGLY